MLAGNFKLVEWTSQEGAATDPSPYLPPDLLLGAAVPQDSALLWARSLKKDPHEPYQLIKCDMAPVAAPYGPSPARTLFLSWTSRVVGVPTPFADLRFYLCSRWKGQPRHETLTTNPISILPGAP